MTYSANLQGLKKFTSKWTGRGKEDEDDRSYWIDLLQDVFGLTNVTDRLDFQKKVIGADHNTKRIDAYIPETRVLIEQKSLNIQLDKPQSGHSGKTPYEQAKEYDNGLPTSEKARWIVISNFAEIWVYDMDTRKPEDSVEIIHLDRLERDYKKLYFLFDPQVEQIAHEFEISQEAGTQIGRIYDALIKQYPSNPSEDDLKNLNTFCVRLVFCYYAEDAGLFDDKLFSNYIASFNPQHLRNGLKELFRILNTKEDERDPFEEKALLAFPYVNGGLFDGSNNIIPQMDANIQKILVSAADFDWAGISPTIFGAIFESTLNQETRRNNGMHYTAIENIHKVIDPLFLNDLKSELEEIKASKQPNVRVQKLRAFQDKLASLKFLDPACGSGNFLTETYLSLRRLENDIINTINRDQIELADVNANPIKVHLSQFYGIEINDFAVSVARTALWIAENQMMNQTKEIIYNAESLNFLPLKSFTNIKEGNALQIEWNNVISAQSCNYIMGNPPFVGYAYQSDSQKKDMKDVGLSSGNVDYVSAWYIKAADYAQNTPCKIAFVSTNSITQGAQVCALWKQLIEELNVNIIFARRTFRWDSEANIIAHVHCVIIGFVCGEYNGDRLIYDGDKTIIASNINGYLVDADNVFIDKRMHPICSVPDLYMGSSALDDGKLILDQEEYEQVIKSFPGIESLIRPYMMGKDFIERKPRYCFWLVGANPADVQKYKELQNRLIHIRNFREKSTRKQTHEAAKTPGLFGEIRNCVTDYVAIPKVSSEKRIYIPIDYLSSEVIAGDKLFQMPNASLYHFGVLTSNVQNAWMRAVCGRLEMRYSYSNTIVYNNFPWPTPTKEQIESIEKTAQSILDARSLYPDSNLADLYDPLTMPSELIKAHEANDKAVMKAYGFDNKISEPEIVAKLFEMYQALT